MIIMYEKDVEETGN